MITTVFKFLPMYDNERAKCSNQPYYLAKYGIEITEAKNEKYSKCQSKSNCLCHLDLFGVFVRFFLSISHFTTILCRTIFAKYFLKNNVFA